MVKAVEIKSHEVERREDEVVLECKGVGVCYRRPKKFGQKNSLDSREFWPFRGLDLKIYRGETLGVTGRNGSGKSTLLRLLAGVTEPDEGAIVRKSGLSVQLLTINLGFERILSGRENAIMAGMLLGKERAYMLEQLDEIKEFSELGEFFDEPVYTYSSGMRARLGFSIALRASPDILLLDEILAVGDKEFKVKSREATQGLIRSGKTVVLVSHGKTTQDELADRIIRLK